MHGCRIELRADDGEIAEHKTVGLIQSLFWAFHWPRDAAKMVLKSVRTPKPAAGTTILPARKRAMVICFALCVALRPVLLAMDYRSLMNVRGNFTLVSCTGNICAGLHQ